MTGLLKTMRRLTSGFGALSFAMLVTVPAWAEDLIGQPTDRAIDMQPAASVMRHESIWFHNWILMPIITVISLFVLGLLVWVAVRYNSRANPVPARWSHNTLIEITWTAVPVLILMVISIFSFRLLFNYHAMPPVDVTVKATARQWNWDYEYPDQRIAAFTSAMLPEVDARARGVPFRLASTAPMVVPVGRVVRVLVTAEDVIHAFAMPAFGNKIDAVPGRVNETWFRAERIGTYYGQCSELCGIDHAFMPIEIRVVSQADFNAWVAQRATPAPPPAAAAPVAAVPGAAAAPVAASTIPAVAGGPAAAATPAASAAAPPANPTAPAAPAAVPAR